MNIKNLIIETFMNIKNPSKHRKDYNAAKGLDVFALLQQNMDNRK